MLHDIAGDLLHLLLRILCDLLRAVNQGIARLTQQLILTLGLWQGESYSGTDGQSNCADGEWVLIQRVLEAIFDPLCLVLGLVGNLSDRFLGLASNSTGRPVSG